MKAKILIPAAIGIGLLVVGTLLIMHLSTPEKLLAISGPTWIEAGENATFTVTFEGRPVAGATVEVAGMSRVTGSDGTATFALNEPRGYEVVATKEGYGGISQVLFQDDFSDASQWFVHKGGLLADEGWFIEYDGEKSFLRLTDELLLSPRQDVTDNACLVWENYSIKTEFRFVDGGWLQVCFRYSTRGEYTVQVGGQHIELWKKVPSENYSIPENYTGDVRAIDEKVKEQGIDFGVGWREMEIIALGRNISVALDGELLFTWADDDTKFERRPHLKGTIDFKGENVDVGNVVIRLVAQGKSAARTAIKVYPKENEQIRFRGAKEGRADAMIRWADAREIGANLVPLARDYYVNAATGSIESPQAWEPIRARIRSVHYRGMKVHFHPFFWSSEGEWGGPVPENMRQEFLKNATAIVLDCARFAENNEVEIFSPTFNMYGFVPRDTANEWQQSIRPQIREVYSGIITLGKNEIDDGDRLLDPSEVEFNHSGYDYTGISVGFPQWDASEVGVDQTYDNYRQWVREMVEVGNEWSEKYGTQGIYVPFVYTDFRENFVRAALDNGMTMGQIRAKVLDIFFQETAENLKGCIVDSWEERLNQKCFYIASTLDQEGVSHAQAIFWGYQGPEVEELVKQYYTVQ